MKFFPVKGFEDIPEVCKDLTYTIVFPPSIKVPVGKRWKQVGHLKQTGTFMIRSLIQDIYEYYLPGKYNALQCIKATDYSGLAFETQLDLENILIKIINKSTPDFWTKTLDKLIKDKPMATKLIYFVNGHHSMHDAFIMNGITEINAKHIEDYLKDTHYKKPLATMSPVPIPTNDRLEEHKAMYEKRVANGIKAEKEIEAIEKQLLEHNPELAEAVKKLQKRHVSKMSPTYKEKIENS